MPFGHIAAQLLHAAGESVSKKVPSGTYAIALAANNEQELVTLSEKLKDSGIKHTLIREPDAPYHNAAMAIGIAPCHRYLVKPYLSSFKLIK